MSLPNETTAKDAQAAIAQLASTISALVQVVDQETALLRAGNLKQAAGVAEKKTDLARAFMHSSAQIMSERARLARERPNELRVLRDLHKQLQSRLQSNMVVVATAHAVSEGIIRGVSDEMVRKASPSTYGAGGRATAPSPRASQPLAVSRSI